MPKQRNQLVQLTPLPAEGLIRMAQVLAVFPVGRTTWQNGVRSGRYPKPVRIGKSAVAWRVEDIRRLFSPA